MIRTSSTRFFLVVSPSPVWMRLAFGAGSAVGAWTLWLNPADVDSALGSVLLLQMFSASSGFAISAARGHYDPLLVSGRSRVRIAVGSLIASAAPGVIAWLGIVAVATALGRGAAALALHRQMALVLVSVCAWAIGLPLPRLAAGALWSGILLALALSRDIAPDYLAVVHAVPVGTGASLLSALAFAICPFLLLGDFPAARHLGVMSLDALFAGSAVTMAARYISRREYCLTEPA